MFERIDNFVMKHKSTYKTLQTDRLKFTVVPQFISGPMNSIES